MTSVLLAAAVLLLLAPELVGLGETLGFVMLASLRPLMAAAVLVLAVLSVLVRRRWWPPAASVALASVVGLVLVGVARAVPVDCPVPGRNLTVLSFNVDEGQADPVALATTIHAAVPDVVVLPEAGDAYRQKLLPELAGLGYRGWATVPADRPDVEGIVVLTGPELGSVDEQVLSEGTEFRWILLSGGALGDAEIVALHAIAPLPGLWPRWLDDLRALRTWCAPDTRPAVLAGDFNATLDQAPFRAVTADCRDAGATAGRGLVATWPTSLPSWTGVQIDHVLGAGGVRPTSFEVLDLPGSDHRAVLSRVLVPRVAP